MYNKDFIFENIGNFSYSHLISVQKVNNTLILLWLFWVLIHLPINNQITFNKYSNHMIQFLIVLYSN